MPYISKKFRDDIGRPPQEGEIAEIINCSQIASAGQLNYAITRLLVNYMNYQGMKYQTFNDIIGALIGAKDEFYRRVVVKYEKDKMFENGDVYD